jgi:CBS domain containing-hemolysin-like protein
MSSMAALLLALGAALAAAAFFAACEGALWTFGSSRGEEAPAEASPSRPDSRLSNAVAFGHLLALVGFGALAWYAAASRFGAKPVEGLLWWEWLAALVVTAFVAHALGEQVPRALVGEGSLTWFRRARKVLEWWRVLVTPITAPVAAFKTIAGRLAETPAARHAPFTSHEMQSIVDETSARADLAAEERQMITSIFSFGETTAREVMTPRTRMVALEAKTEIADAIARVREAEYSRVPVFRDTLDTIVGVLYAKDLLSIAHGHAPPPDALGRLVREATFVPEAKKIDDLLGEMQRERIHMAVVADEYGGTAGIVTLEDILEELVGEIQDEYDQEASLVVPLPDGALRVDGRLDADDFNELTGAGLEAEGGVETVGGLIARELGRVPEGGETVHLGGWNFRVEGVGGKRVTVLRAWEE